MNIHELDNLIEKLWAENTPLQEGFMNSFVKTSITIQKSHLQKLKGIAWLKNTTIKDIICQIIASSLESIENFSFAKTSTACPDSEWTKSSITFPARNLDRLRVIATIKKSSIRDILYLFLENYLSKIEIQSSLKGDVCEKSLRKTL